MIRISPLHLLPLFLLPVFLLLLSYKLTLLFYPLTTPQRETLDFLQGKGDLVLPYTTEELSHLQDVQQVMEKADLLFYLLFLATILLFSYSWKMGASADYLHRGGIATVSILGILFLFLLLGFKASFTLFHQLFFPQGNWQFPAESLLIQTFPLEFFVKIGLMIFLIPLVLGTLLAALSFWMEKFYKPIGNTVPMVHPEEQGWWDQAKSDLDTARFLFSGKKHAESSFFCQQAVEKALKRMMLNQGRPIRKIHDLVVLGREVKMPDRLLEEVKELTRAYIYTRYPILQGRVNIKEKAAQFLAVAEVILQWVDENLSKKN